MKNLKFNEIYFTTSGRNLAMETLENMENNDRRFLEQALVHEYEETENIDHQMLTAGDVLRVVEVLKIQV